MFRTKRRGRLFGAGSVVVFFVLASSIIFKKPWRRVSTQSRIAAFPTQGLPLSRPARILWNEKQIPYIDAKTDEDAAFLVGMVHAHLRLGQMELTRRIAFGRLSESLGSKTVPLDEFLRALHFDKHAQRMESMLPPSTRIWLLRFVEGINFYRLHRSTDSFEFRYLNVKDSEPWTVHDVLTISKLIAADFNWGLLLSFLNLSTERGFEAYWKGFHGLADQEGSKIASLFSYVSESGSNSFAVQGRKTLSGQPLLAGDPHLGIAVPGFWMILGIKSPSYNLVGLSIPSIPIVAIGRNDSIAWGGTNMHAWSTDLVDVSQEDPTRWTSREERIGVRLGKDRILSIRESSFGPILNDLALFNNPNLQGKYALRWVGTEASDEITAFLKVNRAKTWPEFKNAFDTYDAVGIYYTYADRYGNVGLVPAAKLPRRKAGKGLLYHPGQDPHRWERTERLNRALSLFNPGPWIVSSNQPPVADSRLTSPFRAHASRFYRIDELLRQQGKIGRDEVLKIQKDVFSKSALEFAKTLAKVLQPKSPTYAATLKAWDGRFSIDQEEPLDVSLFAYHLAHRLYEKKTSSKVLEAMLASGKLFDVLTEDLRAIDWDASVLETVVASVEKDRKKFKTFGEYHRIRLSYPLSVLPLIGKKFVFRDLPWPGSSDTVMKASFAISDQVRNVTFGAQARYVFDFSDPDANDFMLLGGEDGWLGSENFHDMVDDWMQDRWVRVPMGVVSAEKTFLQKTELSPAATSNAGAE